MTIRRTLHLTKKLDRLLNEYADLNNVSSSSVMRDALSVFFSVDGSAHPILERMGRMLDNLEQRPALVLTPSHDPVRYRLEEMGLIPKKSPS
jgi:hypothetical protein